MGSDKENFLKGNRGYLNRAYVMLTSLALIPMRAYEQIGKLPAITHIGSYQVRLSLIGSLSLYFILSIPNKYAKDRVLGLLEKITRIIDPSGTREREQMLVSDQFCETAMAAEEVVETATTIVHQLDH